MSETVLSWARFFSLKALKRLLGKDYMSHESNRLSRWHFQTRVLDRANSKIVFIIDR